MEVVKRPHQIPRIYSIERKEVSIMSKQKESRIAERSARTGQFVKTGTEKRQPNTTVRERLPLPGKGKGR
jgi:hypothetical protein